MIQTESLPSIIQGGMGVAVSDWRLARAVSRRGQLGVVSGTAIDTVFVRRLQDGDPGGHLRRALAHFPIPGVVEEVLAKYFRPEGRPKGARYRLLPLMRERLSRAREALILAASFAEVWLAKEGHDGPVGLNLLTKVQIPTLSTLYGAMLADVDYVLMGAGIPKEIPGALDRLARHDPATLKLDIEGPAGEPDVFLAFDPRLHWHAVPAPLRRPRFLPIVSSHSLATLLARKASGRVDGFVIEGPVAGGHNAPPRGPLRLDEHGEPVYGERDAVDLAAIQALGLPFWLAGGAGHPAQLRTARALGAAGVQVGTLFAWCEESGFAPALKADVLAHAARGEVTVRTDPRASPTGYPFKVVQWPGASETAGRDRVCDLGVLRVPYRMTDGRLGYRCSGEPEADYVRKGGAPEDTVGRQCLCNGLTAAEGQAQIRRDGSPEPALVTSGDDLESVAGFLRGRAHYTAADVIDYLLDASPR